MSRVAVVALALCLAACAVDDSALRTRVYPCTTASDCSHGWGCVKASPYAVDFCAPSCDVPCDGICVSDAAYPSGLCLRGCTLGAPNACQSDAYSCIRTNVASSRGVCYPVTTCDVVMGSRQGSCAAGQNCLSLTDHMPGAIMGDYLYCVPAPDPTATPECPMGALAFPPPAQRRDGNASCFPSCSVTDKRCPPAFGCFTQASLFSGLSPYCLYGLYGISCDSDANCLQGHCLDVPGQGKICTTTCADADMVAPGRGCGGLVDLAAAVGLDFYTMQCDPTGTGVCAVEYSRAYIPCSTAYPCAGRFSTTNSATLSCVTFGSGIAAFSLCSAACTTDAECDVSAMERGFCYATGTPTGSVCFPRLQTDATCTENRQCQSDVCRPAMHTCA